MPASYVPVRLILKMLFAGLKYKSKLRKASVIFEKTLRAEGIPADIAKQLSNYYLSIK